MNKPGIPVTVIGLCAVAVLGLITQYLAAEHAHWLSRSLQPPMDTSISSRYFTRWREYIPCYSPIWMQRLPNSMRG